jgi:hypothetical protein
VPPLSPPPPPRAPLVIGLWLGLGVCGLGGGILRAATSGPQRPPAPATTPGTAPAADPGALSGVWAGAGAQSYAKRHMQYPQLLGVHGRLAAWAAAGRGLLSLPWPCGLRPPSGAAKPEFGFPCVLVVRLPAVPQA